MKIASIFVTIIFHGFLFCQSNTEYNGQPQNNLKVEQLQLKKQSLIECYDSTLLLALNNSRVAKSKLQELKKSKNINKDLMSSFDVDDEKFKAYLLLQKEKIINPESVKYNSYLSYLNKTFVSASEILLITHNGFFCGFVDSLGQIIDCTKIFFSEEQQQKIDKYILNGKLNFVKSNQEILESLTDVSIGYLYLNDEYERLDNEIIAIVSQLNRIEISIDELHKKHEKELIKLDNEIDLILKPQTTTQSTNYFGSGGSGNGSGNGPFGGPGNGIGDGDGIGSGKGSGKGRVRINHDLSEIPNYDIDNTCRIKFDLKVDSTGSIIQILVNSEKTTCRGESIITDLSERIQNEVKFQKNTNALVTNEIYFITLRGKDFK